MNQSDKKNGHNYTGLCILRECPREMYVRDADEEKAEVTEGHIDSSAYADRVRTPEILTARQRFDTLLQGQEAVYKPRQKKFGRHVHTGDEDGERETSASPISQNPLVAQREADADYVPRQDILTDAHTAEEAMPRVTFLFDGDLEDCCGHQKDQAHKCWNDQLKGDWGHPTPLFLLLASPVT